MKRRCLATILAALAYLASDAWFAAARSRGSIHEDLVDLTNETAVEFGDLTFSPEARQLNIGIRIRNGSERLLSKPLRLQITDVRSKLGEVTPAATTLEFDSEIPARGLRLGEATRDKTIVFKFAGDSPLRIDRSTGEILTMAFRVHGR